MYSSVKRDTNWEIDIVLLYRLGNSLSVGLCFAQVQMPSQIPPFTGDLTSSLCSVPWLVSSPLGFLCHISFRFFLKTFHAAERTIVCLCSFTKCVPALCILQVLALIALETWQVLTTETNMAKLESFLSSHPVGLQFFILFTEENGKSGAFLLRMWLISLNPYSINTSSFLDPLKTYLLLLPGRSKFSKQ